MAYFIMTGEIMGGENVADIVQNRQFFPVIILPVTLLHKIFPKFQENLLVSFCSTMINEDI